VGVFCYERKTMNQEVKVLTLNKDQQLAADGFFQFLMGPEKEMIISGPGGVGKTFLMGHLIDDIMPQYEQTCQMMGIDPKYTSVEMTATTNKAAEVLGIATNRPTSTIHSFLGLKVEDDYKTGKSKLTKTTNWKVHQNIVLFIDECSMIDTDLRRYLMEGTMNCKIIYVGDHCQLAPVYESLSPIYRDNLTQFVLLEQMRNCGQPALMDLCTQLRSTVETGEFKPIRIIPGVIDLFDSQSMQQLIDQTFSVETKMARVLTYTNKRAIEYNEYIREIRNYGPAFHIGETLINNSAIQLKAQGMLSVEQEVRIVRENESTEHDEIDDGVTLEVRRVDLEDNFGKVYYNIGLPVNREHFTALLKHYSKAKKWYVYYNKLKNVYPDLRSREAATVHKSQGSTYDVAFIDLTDLSTCTNPNMAARLLYVAFSRAKHRVIMYGNLADRFGGLIQ
jgi:exodeoxyribonuclease-5